MEHCEKGETMINLKRYTFWLNHQVNTVFAIEYKNCEPYFEKFQKDTLWIRKELKKIGHTLSGTLSISGNMYWITDVPYTQSNIQLENIVDEYNEQSNKDNKK